MPRTAIITGANRGLGLGTARALAARGDRVVGTARDPSAGPSDVTLFALDVTDDASVAAFAARAAEQIGEWNVLVNNAGIALNGFDAEVARRTIDVNVRGPMRVFDELWPHRGADPVIVNVSSGMGELGALGSPLRERYAAGTMTRDEVLALADAFVEAVAAGTHAREGWPSSAYGVSKLSLNAWTRALARELGDAARVNAVCPGWVRTDMGGRHASRSVEEGAASIVWAATLGPDGPTGGFFRDGHPASW